MIDALLVAYTAFIFGMNNSGLVSGSIVALGLSYKRAVIITALGFALGFMVEGGKMSSVLLDFSSISYDIPLVITSIIFSIFSFLGLPISMINILIGSYIGSSIASNVEFNTSMLRLIIASWIITPFIALAASMALYISILRMIEKFSLLAVNRFYSISMQILTFYTAYVLAANNLGLLYNASIVFLPLSSILGIIIGRKVALLISQEIVGHSQATLLSSLSISIILLWIYTQLSIPISLTQLLLAGLLGVNMYRKPRIYNRKRLLLLISSWIGSTLVSIYLAYTITYLLGSQ